MLIQAYQEGWAEDFQQIKKVLHEVLPPSVAVEHIGSTAVPGLAAKPIIDIDLGMEHRQAFEQIKRQLAQVGYYHNGNQGIPDREVFKRATLAPVHPVLDAIRHHLYVCPADSAELKQHLVLRDHLRTHPADRAQYQDLKYEIAALAQQDQKQYAALKEIKAKAFIEGILSAYLVGDDHSSG